MKILFVTLLALTALAEQVAESEKSGLVEETKKEEQQVSQEKTQDLEIAEVISEEKVHETLQQQEIEETERRPKKKPFSDDEIHSLSQDDLLSGHHFNRSFPRRQLRSSPVIRRRGRQGRAMSVKSASIKVFPTEKLKKKASLKHESEVAAIENLSQSQKVVHVKPDFGAIIVSGKAPAPRAYYNTVKPVQPESGVVPILFDGRDVEYAKRKLAAEVKVVESPQEPKASPVPRQQSFRYLQGDLKLMPIKEPKFTGGQYAPGDLKQRQYEYGFGKQQAENIERQARIRDIAEAHRQDVIKRTTSDRGIWNTLRRRGTIKID